MNFDDLKSNYQSLSYGAGDHNNVDFTKKIERIVERVRKEDQKDKQRLVGVSIIAVGFGGASAVIGALRYLENSGGMGHWPFLLYFLAILSFMPILIREYQRNQMISYDVSLIQFIEKVEKRFALFQISDLWLIPGFLLLGSSMALMISGSLLPNLQTILIALLFLILAATIGCLTRLVVWRHKLFLREELHRLKETIQ